MKRRIFIGDIQGCREELERLLAEARFDPANDTLHPVGDLVNRGPDSAGALRVLRDAGATGVLGNHDVHLLRAAHGLRAPGPRDTFHDVLEAPDRAELLGWLVTQPFLREWDDAILVHGGLHPAWTREGTVDGSLAARFAGVDPLKPSEDARYAITVRSCAADGSRPPADWPPPREPFRPWFEHYPGRPEETRTVVFGHWARMGLVVRPQARGLDTGCVWGGALTAWIPEEDRIVQVPAARAHSSHVD